MFLLRTRVKFAAFQFVSGALSLIARNIPEERGGGSILVISPHPDDETLSCGASIARAYANGLRVRVVVVTDGSTSSRSKLISPQQLAVIRKNEAKKAIVKLGGTAEDVHFLDFKDGETSQFVHEIANEIEKQVASFEPERIYSPYPIDPHADHRAIGKAVAKLIRRGALSSRVFEYPRFQPRSLIQHLLMPRQCLQLRCIATEGLLPIKRAALDEYVSQCENLTGEDTWNVLEPHWVRMFFQSSEIFFEHPQCMMRRLGSTVQPAAE